MGEKRNAYRLLVGKPEGKRPLGTPGRRWVDNISMDLGEVTVVLRSIVLVSLRRYSFKQEQARLPLIRHAILERKISGSGLENLKYRHRDPSR
jgi:hypothetical protein